MTWDEWIRENHQKLVADGTRFELIFVQQILSRVPGLSPENVAAQTGYHDLHGKPRRIDFTISEGKHVRIAIEVDGFDKDGTGRGPRSQFRDWSFREISMVAVGWVPLRFANGLISQEPAALIESIALELSKQRGFEEAVKSNAELIRKAQRRDIELRSAAKAASSGDEDAEGLLREIYSRFDAYRSTYLTDEDQHRLHELQELISRQNQTLLQEKERRKSVEKENRGMKLLGIAFALALVAVVAFFVLRGSDGESGPDSTSANNDFELASRCDDAVSSGDLTEEKVGSIVSVRGEVAGTRRIDGPGPEVYLNLGNDYPDQDVAVVIWSDDVDNWSTPPEDRYDSRAVAVTGELDEFDGALQIAANSPNDIAICS